MTAPAAHPLAAPARQPVTLLCCAVLALMIFPSRFVLAGPLASAGSPSVMLGLLALLVYVVGRMARRSTLSSSPDLVRSTLWLFFAAILIAYGVGHTRPLSAIEGPGADRSLVLFLSLLGLALLMLDGILHRDGLDRVLICLLYGGYFSALVGVLQFHLGLDLAAQLQIPGFVLNGELFARDRSLFRRASGTSLHAIEFGVVLATLVPLAHHYWLRSRHWERKIHGSGFFLLLFAAPMSVSRSAVVGLAVAFVVYISPWGWSRKLNALVLSAIGVVVLRTAVPGLVGTLRSAFANVNNDPSISGRTNDYAEVNRFILERPWFGRGLGTFRPDAYFTLDNQVLGTFLEGGIVLFLSSTALYVIGAASARSAGRRQPDGDTRGLGQAIAAGIVVLAVTSLLYDQFAFRQSVTLLFVLVAAGGVLRRLSLAADDASGRSGRPDGPAGPGRAQAGPSAAARP